MSTLKLACRCAVSDGVPRRSLYVALVVGTILNLINQGDALFGAAEVNWIKIVLTYLVPYAVCTYGAVSYQLRRAGLAHKSGGESTAK
jgi:hypothetical protein